MPVYLKKHYPWHAGFSCFPNHKKIVSLQFQNCVFMQKRILFLFLAFVVVARSLSAQRITVAAEIVSDYLPLLKDKNVAVVGNQTSMVGNEHLVDTLLSSGVRVKKIFCPEHGFRGNNEAGAKINNEIDNVTGLPIISLYGKTKKPTREHLSGIDVVVFDIQDVGARFYTYISTLHYVMEACAENSVEVVVFDRPNPNGFYVDGPVLDPKFKSFVGMHPVPVVHGMTMGEYAQMIKGERWINRADSCRLRVVKMKNYTHDSLYEVPVAPSPNLQQMNAIYLYPSLCCFEGTNVSVGRGTALPFEIIGSPSFSKHDFMFIPRPIAGVSQNPPHKDQKCYGMNLENAGREIIASKKLNLTYLMTMYRYSRKKDFFLKNNFFNLLMGNDLLMKQIKNGASEKEIRDSWEPELSNFKAMRQKYLLYE